MVEVGGSRGRLAQLRIHYVEAYHGQVHSACRGALNVAAKAGCREGVHGVFYSMDI
jgi:hypothetical protein